jgi:hypothetical protein
LSLIDDDDDASIRPLFDPKKKRLAVAEDLAQI